MARPVPSITCLFTLLAPATLLIASCASAGDAATAPPACRIDPHPPELPAHEEGEFGPPGSATHTLQLLSAQLDVAHATLADAHSGLIHALGGATTDPPPLARAVGNQHQQWLTFRNADCELAGTLTGAGGAWPSVHGMSCRIEHINHRLETVQQACDCASALPEDAYAFERYACLTELVDWQMEGN